MEKQIKQIIDIFDKYHIKWSWMGDHIFVSGQQAKVLVVRDELNKVKGIKQGFDKDGNYLGGID